MMLKICQICLTTDRQLQTIDESIHNWFDELCDFSIEEYALYCTQCAYLLKKFYKFKQRCVLANNILKKWKKAKANINIKLLKNEIPPTSLGISNRIYEKVYSYKSDMDSENDNYSQAIYRNSVDPISRDSGIVIDTLTICDTKDILRSEKMTTEYKYDINTNIQSKNVNGNENLSSNNTDGEILKEVVVKIEQPDQDSNNLESLQIIAEELKIEGDVDIDSDSNVGSDKDFDIQKLLDEALSSDNSSDNEVLQVKRKKTIAKKNDEPLSEEGDKPIKKRGRKKEKKRGLEALKYSLMRKFENTEVKDEDGTIIDKDCIIDNLENMHNYTYNKIKRYCSDKKPLTPQAIQVLSMVQKRYGNQYSEVFTTEHLITKEDILKEFHKRQEHETYVGTEHKCTLCYRGFKFKKLLDYHIAEFHNPERDFVCEICAMRFKTAQGRRKHIASHKVVFKCKLCPLVTNYRTVMVNHFNYHNGVKYPCELCNGVFKSRPCLAAHMNSMHQTQFICKYCARSFYSETGLAQHQVRKHGEEESSEGPPTAKCDQCNITFISMEVHRKHMDKCHTPRGDKSYVFKTRKRTVERARRRPDYVCRVCNAVEHSIGMLTWHFKQEHPHENSESVCVVGHKYLCHECGKGYSNITDFKEHKYIHTGAKPYTCDVCNKSFHRRMNLRNHLERHQPPKRVCPHCGKKFISPSNLSNHIKMHIGIRRHICELCSKSFLHKSALNAHVRGVHLHIRRARKRVKEPELNA